MMDDQKQPRDWRRAKPWCEAKGISKSTLWRWSRKGTIDTVTIEGVLFVDNNSFDRRAEAGVSRAA